MNGGANRKRVAVIGLAFRFPGTTSDTYWADLLAGRDLVGEIAPDRWTLDAYLHPDPKHPGTAYTRAAGSVGDIAGFDADFFGISPREAGLMDPQQRMLLELGWEAMESAGVAPARLRGSDCGVFVGIASTDYAWRVLEDLDAVDTTMATGNAPSIAANRLSYVYGLRGPSVALDTACSSALVAFHQACRAIAAGDCTHALAGGVSLHLHPYGFIGFSKATMLSPRGRCRVFDASADGYVRSEGAGLFLLKDYEQARADGDPILAVVAASAVNTDGAKSGLTIPCADAQAALMRRACEQAGIAPGEIDYLEAHGTGTPVGDPIEARAIGQALGQPRGAGKPLPIGSVKSNMGHLETASGVAGLVKAIYALRQRVVPATIGVETLNPNIRASEWNIEVVTENRPLPAAGRVVVGVNSFGFGGANAHVILESEAASPPPPLRRPRGRGAPAVPLVITAKTAAAVRDAALQVAARLDGVSDEELYDAAYQLARRRQWHAERAVVFAADAAQACEKLRQLAADDAPAPLRVQAAESVAETASGPLFVYSGNGSQWPGMGAALLEDAVFSQTIDEIDTLFLPLSGWSLRATLADSRDPAQYEATEVAQPALFALQAGMTRMLAQQGVAPAAVVGHSVGEVAAAYVAGCLSLTDAVTVIYQRSRLQGLTRGAGQMSALGLGRDAAHSLLAELGLSERLCIAGVNSASGVTLAGDAQALAQVQAYCEARQIFAVRLPLDYAFHSAAMAPIQAELKASLREIAPQAGAMPFYSTVTGALLDGAELGADYWWRNVREPVQFAPAITAAIGAGHRVSVEVGPHPVLRTYLNDALREMDTPGVVIASARRNDAAPARLLAAAGQVIASGARIEWDTLLPRVGRHTGLPAYPWQRERHGYPGTPESQGLLTRKFVHPLLGYALPQHTVTRHSQSWQQSLDTQSHPLLADHVVGDAVVFPGAGYAELALAVARHVQDVDGTGKTRLDPDAGEGAPRPTYLELEDLDIRAPLLLSAAPSQLLRVTLDASDSRVRIHAKEQGADHDWRLHASARVLAEPGPALLDRAGLAVAELTQTRAPDFAAADHRALTQAVGLHYGPAFCAVAHGWRLDAQTVLAELAAPAAVATELPHYHLHPALLDAAIQLVVHLLAADPAARSAGLAYVPVQVERLALACSPANPTPHYASVRLRRRTPRALVVDIDLYNGDGVAVAALRAVRLKAVRLQKRPDERLGFFNEVITPRPLPGRIAPACMDATALRHALEDITVADTRFGSEVEPLLEALCDRYAVDALLAGEEGASSLHPAYYTHLLQRAINAGYVRLTDGGNPGWAFTGSHQHAPAAADIWNTLLRDYPDAFAAVHALGRVGLNLAQNRPCLEASVTPAQLALLALGGDTLDALNAVLAATLDTAQTHLPAGARLAVLEIGDGCAPLFAHTCVDTLDVSRADYAYASMETSTEADTAASVQQQFAEHGWAVPVYGIGVAENVVHDLNHAEHDLILLHGAFTSFAAAHSALAHAAQRLKPGGVLLWLGQPAAPWRDFLFGAYTQTQRPSQPHWWQKEGGVWRTPQQPLALWRQQLQDHGLACEAVKLPGAAALLATRPVAAVCAAPALADGTHAHAAPPRRVLLLANANGPSAALASALQEHLSHDGHRCLVVTDAERDTLAATLHSARAHLGTLDDILHLDGWGAADDTLSATELTQAQIQRCALAGTLAQACAGQCGNGTPTLWLLTSGVAGADTLAACNDAALWGYGRTLVNEAANCRVRLVDLPTDSASHAPALAALADELNQWDDEDEVFLDRAGTRRAPRLRQVARPGASRAETSPSPLWGGGAGGEGGHSSPPGAGGGGSAARLGFDFPGQLRHLRWEALSAPAALADDAVEVRVHATGLNFRDVMYALGLLSDEALERGFVGASLGLEFAGVVTRAGANVTGYQPGDAVVGFGPASFATLAITSTATLARIPPGWSFEAAATVPSTFFTVYYALSHLAQIQPGERVLIHGAAGGVGIAAVQYAQYCGAEIYATAGSDEKRDFLRLMGVRHLYDSRSLAWADAILADTGGAGVDIVLNSLAGEAIARNLRVLKPFGRFLELGKRDFYENTRVGLRPFRNNISYFGIDADQLMRERPELTRRLFDELMALFAQGVLHPLPYTAFDANDVVAAFRHMQQARQIGKIVVTYRNGVRNVHGAPAPVDTPPALLPADASYLVTGGLQGFGLASAQWLAAKGAKHLILISRSGPQSEQARAAVAELEQQGVRVLAAACDVTDPAALAALLTEAAQTLPPLRGIIHAAAVIDDALAVNATPAQIEHNFAAKVQGARHLHDLTRTTPLDFCVYYSSATTLFGNPGQSAYVAANTWLEALAQHRCAAGLAATCVRWGPIDDVGFLARHDKTKAALASRIGGAALASKAALAALEGILRAGANNLAVLELDWRALARVLPGAAAPKYAELARHAGEDASHHEGAGDIAALLATLDDAALTAQVAELLKAELAEILHLPAARLDATKALADMGLDSLMEAELATALDIRFDVRLPVMALNQNTTVNTLAQQLVALLRANEGSPAEQTPPQTAQDTTEAVAHLAARHAADVSPSEVAEFAARFSTAPQSDGETPKLIP